MTSRDPNSRTSGPLATVIVVEDDPDWMALTVEALDGAGYPVERYTTPAGCLARERWPAHGCLLLDCNLPGMSGIELLVELRRRQVALPAVMMTAFGDVPTAVRAMRVGAFDFLEKPVGAEALLERVAGALAAADAAPPPPIEVQARLAALSPRERQVLDFVVSGLANKQIAGRIGLSIKTVELHRGNLMRKMRAGSLAELVRLALRAGIEPAPGAR
jgi:FixJ family two-component response regulator